MQYKAIQVIIIVREGVTNSNLNASGKKFFHEIFNDFIKFNCWVVLKFYAISLSYVKFYSSNTFCS